MQTTRTSHDFNEGIHGARGLFAFSILIFHVSNSGLPNWAFLDPLANVLDTFKFGVELFFAISGFVIFGTMARSGSPSSFIVNRAIRIFPVLWMAVLAVVAMSLISGREAPAAYGPAELTAYTFANLLALPGVIASLPLFLPPAWSISYEFAFYLLCFVFLAGRFYGRVSLFWPCMLAGLVLIAYYPRALFFLSGLIVAHGWLNHPKVAWLTRFPVLFLALFLICWKMLANDAAPLFTDVFAWIGDPRLVFLPPAFIFATLAVQGIANGHGLLGVFLRTRALLWLGTVSYSLYLWHPVVLAVLKQGLYGSGLVQIAGPASQFLLLAIAIGPVLVVSSASYYCLEKRLGIWLSERVRVRRLSALQG